MAENGSNGAGSIFAGIENARVYRGGQYFQPGMYRVRIESISLFQSEKHNGRWYFAAETSVVETSAPEYGPGSTVSWVQDMSKQSAHSNCKEFALAINPGCNPDEITEEVMETICGPEQPAAGSIVDAEVFHKTSKEGRQYTRVQWRAAEGDFVAGNSNDESPSSSPEETGQVPF